MALNFSTHAEIPVRPGPGSMVVASVRAWLGEKLNPIRLRRVPRRDVDYDILVPADQFDLAEILDPVLFEHEWRALEAQVQRLTGSNASADHSSNAGDRRALYQCVRRLRPRAVLEIGTWLGISTLCIAAAMRQNVRSSGDRPGILTTIDVLDVDSPAHPWRRYGLSRSPRDLIGAAGLANIVEFVTEESSIFLARAGRRFDFAYLDGSTAAARVYRDLQELPNVLHPGAAALLHAYFPRGRPLWPGEPAITGPWRAVNRLQAEGVSIAARPLRELPWQTKRGSRTTSLAFIGRAP